MRDYLEAETDVVIVIVRLPVVDVGQPTVIRITTIETVTMPEISTQIRFDPTTA